MHKVLAPSTIVFILVSLTLVGLKLLFTGYMGKFLVPEQAAAFTWPLIVGIIVIGLMGLFADRAAKLPEPFADMARERRGMLVAAIAGTIYGLITIGSYIWNPTHSAFATGSEWEHMLLPWSIPFYTFGAIFLEFLLRLGALCIGFWFIHVLILRRHYRLAVFWLVAAVVALYEIWPYLSPDIAAHNWSHAVTDLAGALYLSNVFEGWLVLRYGWFTPIVFRLVFYFFWHILFGGFAGPYFWH